MIGASPTLWSYYTELKGRSFSNLVVHWWFSTLYASANYCSEQFDLRNPEFRKIQVLKMDGWWMDRWMEQFGLSRHEDKQQEFHNKIGNKTLTFRKRFFSRAEKDFLWSFLWKITFLHLINKPSVNLSEQKWIRNCIKLAAHSLVFISLL